MMKDYLAQDFTTMTATERLVAHSGNVFNASTSITPAEKLRKMETYLDQLVKQAQGDGSHRESTSSTSSASSF
jgi:hypothetical protein